MSLANLDLKNNMASEISRNQNTLNKYIGNIKQLETLTEACKVKMENNPTIFDAGEIAEAQSILDSILVLNLPL